MSSVPTDTAKRKTALLVAAEYALGYLLLVAVCALLRGGASYFGGPTWLIESTPWPEVFYGPAIVVGILFVGPRVTTIVESWLRRRRA